MIVRSSSWIMRPQVSLYGRLDSQRPEQFGGRGTRVSCLAKDRVQALLGEVMEHQVDDAPWVEGLAASCSTALAAWSSGWPRWPPAAKRFR
jgi:hypothetical protein